MVTVKRSRAKQFKIDCSGGFSSPSVVHQLNSNRCHQKGFSTGSSIAGEGGGGNTGHTYAKATEADTARPNKTKITHFCTCCNPAYRLYYSPVLLFAQVVRVEVLRLSGDKSDAFASYGVSIIGTAISAFDGSRLHHSQHISQSASPATCSSLDAAILVRRRAMLFGIPVPRSLAAIVVVVVVLIHCSADGFNSHASLQQQQKRNYLSTKKNSSVNNNKSRATLANTLNSLANNNTIDEQKENTHISCVDRFRSLSPPPQASVQLLDIRARINVSLLIGPKCFFCARTESTSGWDVENVHEVER